MKFFLIATLFLQSPILLADALTDRLNGFASQKNLQGSFVEMWSASYLSEPLVTQGKLFYKAPDQLIKIIERPDAIVQTIESDQLTIKRDEDLRTLQLSEQPTLAAGIYALRSVLQGSKKNLKQYFNLRFNEFDSGWTLKLLPKQPVVAEKIKVIILRGTDNKIQQVRIQYHNGDSLRTEISHDG